MTLEVAGSGFVPFPPVFSHLGQCGHLSVPHWCMGTHPGLSAQCWGMRDFPQAVLLAKDRVTSETGNEKLLMVRGKFQDHKSTV